MKHIIYFFILCQPFVRAQVLSPVLSVNFNTPLGSLQTATGVVTGAGYDPSTDGYDVTQGCIPFTGFKSASGDYKIFAPPGQSPLTFSKVVIVLEGFDLKNELNVDGIFNKLQTLGTHLTNNLNAHVIVLNYTDSKDYIERNANMLIELINQVNNSKIGAEENIIIGASMGGLVIRQALTTMENMGIGHECKLYMSIDTPHRGANIPVGAQEHVKDMVNNSLLQTVVNGKPINDSIVILYNSLTSPAASQMLRHLIGSNGFPDAFPDSQSPISTNCIIYFNKLRAINGCGRGYPGNCKNVALTLGALNAFAQIDDKTPFNFVIPGAMASSYTVSSPISNTYLNPLLGIPPNFPLFQVSNSFFNYPFSNVTNPPSMTTNMSKISYFQASIHKHVPNSLIDLAPGGFNTVFNEIMHGVTKGINNSNNNLDVAVSSKISSIIGTNVNIQLGVLSTNTVSNNKQHCFVPTISSLDYKDVNLFRNISNDITAGTHLSNTPFDDFYGEPNANIEHIDNIPSTIISKAAVLLTSAPISVCGNPNLAITGITNSNRMFQKAQYMLTIDNTSLSNISLFELKAGDEVALLDNTSMIAGAEGSVYIRPCNTPKACTFSFAGFKGGDSPTEDIFWTMKADGTDYLKNYVEGKYCLKSQNTNGVEYFVYEGCDLEQVTANGETINDVIKNDKSGILIFPNPNNGVFNIVLNHNYTDSEIIIYDNLGKTVFVTNTLNSNKSEVNLNDLNKGVYFVHIKKSGTVLSTEKLVVQ